MEEYSDFLFGLQSILITILCCLCSVVIGATIVLPQLEQARVDKEEEEEKEEEEKTLEKSINFGE